jgi:Fe-S oxidoreductase
MGNEKNIQKPLDLSIKNIKKLHEKFKTQNGHLYEFLKKEFPELSTEDRLKYLASVLNDYIEEYEWDEKAERHREDGYSIVKFYSKDRL